MKKTSILWLIVFRWRDKSRLKSMLFAVLVTSAALAAGQPCHEDRTCFEGYFCNEYSYVCRPCLSCKDLQREEPAVKSDCIKSVTKCGPCLKGLMDSRAGDLTCVPREEGTSPASDNNYTPWIIAAVVIVVLVVLLAVLVTYLFKKSSFSVGFNTEKYVVPSAPEAPPPYSPHHRSDTVQPNEIQEETELPLVKTYQPPFPAHQSQDHGKAGVYNPPSYVRLPNSQPPQPEDVNGNYSPGDGDDDTTPSAWVPQANNTPAAPDPNGSGPSGRAPDAAGTSLSTQLAAARDTELIQLPAVAVRLQPEPEPTPPRSGRNGNYNIMNVNQFITISKPLF